MKIPKTIKVAGKEYIVERPEQSFVDAAEACDGIHMYASEIIKVAKRGTEHYQNTVFLHEVLHAIDYTYCGGVLDEKTIESLAVGLYQVIKDHPNVFNNNNEIDS